MATTIVTKKGSGAPAASDLVEGELAVDTTNGRLYTENSSAAVVELGSNPSGNITFGDNGKAIFGAGSDATLHSDGSTGYARGFVLQNTAGNKDVLTFVDGGATTLLHNNAAKLATTSTGIDVTGTMTATKLVSANGVLELDDNGTHNGVINSPASLIINIDSDANSTGEDFIIAKDRTSTSGGTELFRVQEDGNVGIGTSTATSIQGFAKVLKVEDAGSTSIVVSGDVHEAEYAVSANGGWFGTSTNIPQRFVTNNTERMRIDASGNVAIGGDINGNGVLTLNTPTDSSPQIVFSENNTGKWLIGHRHDGDHFRFYDLANSAERMRIDSSGNVGIGTDSPAIGGGRTYALALTIDGGVSGGLEDTGGLEIGGSTSVNDRIVGSISYFNRDNSGAGATTRQQVAIIEARSVTSDSNAGDDSGGNLTFGTKSEGGSIAERMRLDSSGNLLVGGTSASAKLIVDAGLSSGETIRADNSKASFAGVNIYSVLLGSSTNNATSRHFQGYAEGATRFVVYGNGAVYGNGTYGTYSDLKLKENIVDANSQWADIKAVQLKNYSMKEDGLSEANQLGVIAQDLEASGMQKLVEEIDDKDVDGNLLSTATKHVKYSVLHLKALGALQEAMERIESLEARIAALES